MNFKFLFKSVFTYCFGLQLFRRDLRCNNPDVILAAINKLSSLFYGLNMTQYMEIDIRHNITMSQCPDDIKQFINQTIGMSQSGHPSKCEGVDFILESTYRRMKMWTPPDVPTLK